MFTFAITTHITLRHNILYFTKFVDVTTYSYVDGYMRTHESKR